MVGARNVDDVQPIHNGDRAGRDTIVQQAGGYGVVAQQGAKQVDRDTAMSYRGNRTRRFHLVLKERVQPCGGLSGGVTGAGSEVAVAPAACPVGQEVLDRLGAVPVHTLPQPIVATNLKPGYRSDVLGGLPAPTQRTALDRTPAE